MTHPRSSAGFTLIETLVAIGIFTLAIVAPLIAASRALEAAGIARDTLIATYLAQEDIEVARAMRSTMYLINPATTDVNTSFTPCISPKTCDVLYVGSGFIDCPGGACPALYLDPATGFYNHGGGGAASPFTRSMTAVRNPNGLEGILRVTVTVRWNSHGPHTVTLTEDFYDWF